MSRYVILVEFSLHDDTRESFMPLMLANAQASVDNEPGCERFDVLSRGDAPNEIVLYEIYSDKAAFQAHLKTPHFLEFNSTTAAMIKSKRIVELDYLNDAGL